MTFATSPATVQPGTGAAPGVANSTNDNHPHTANSTAFTNHEQFVTVFIDDQLFGLPIGRVQDVFRPEAITRVPLSPPEIAGVLNLRGRIVTAIDMRHALSIRAHLPVPENRMAVGVESNGESYGLILDRVGEVIPLTPDSHDANPVNLAPQWAGIANGVHRLDQELMIVLNVDRVLQNLAHRHI